MLNDSLHLSQHLTLYLSLHLSLHLHLMLYLFLHLHLISYLSLHLPTSQSTSQSCTSQLTTQSASQSACQSRTYQVKILTWPACIVAADNRPSGKTGLGTVQEQPNSKLPGKLRHMLTLMVLRLQQFWRNLF